MHHTPLPWRVVNKVDVQSGNIGGLAYVSTAGARGRTLEEAEANAKFIVKACNHHEALVDLLFEILDAAELTHAEPVEGTSDDEPVYGGHNGPTWGLVRRMQALLNKVEGE